MKPNFITKIKDSLKSGNQRTSNLIKNITGSTLLRGVDVLISLLLVPLTISYVNPTQWGIWLTISSITGWIAYFNIGINLGFKNRFAESLAMGDEEAAKQYVSTTYALMTLIFVPVCLICVILNQFADWPSFLKIEQNYYLELRRTFDVLIVCFCFSMIVKIINIMLDADQKIVWSSLISTLSHALMLGVIYVMTLTTKGTLLGLAFANSGVPLLFIVLASFIVFSQNRYRKYIPRFRNINFALSKNIIGLGVQFFLINIASLFIFQMINVVISRELGPDMVSQYGVAYRYFFVVNQFFMVIVIPYWPAFTDAYAKGDYIWMKNLSKKLEKVFLLFIPILVVLLILAPVAYHYWIGDKLTVPFEVSLMTFFYVLSRMSGDMYNYLLNGIGKVRLQTILYALFAVIAIPAMTFFGKQFGLIGILAIPTFTMLTQALVGRIQIRKLLEKKASGIWDK